MLIYYKLCIPKYIPCLIKKIINYLKFLMMTPEKIVNILMKKEKVEHAIHPESCQRMSYTHITDWCTEEFCPHITHALPLHQVEMSTSFYVFHLAQFLNWFIEERVHWLLNMSVRLQVKGEINILLKNCLKCVSLELSGKTLWPMNN